MTPDLNALAAQREIVLFVGSGLSSDAPASLLRWDEFNAAGSRLRVRGKVDAGVASALS
jgi:hypothetical protein